MFRHILWQFPTFCIVSVSDSISANSCFALFGLLSFLFCFYVAVPLLIPKTEALSRSSSVDHPNNNNNTKDSAKDQSLLNATPNANSSIDGSDGVQSDVTTTPSSGRQPQRRRARRRAASSSQDPAEALTEMSVRGLNLFRYASVTEGVYKCMECAKVDVIKTFKNKYSFQRHAFLYHEGHQRKVFPCPVCAKEFSRPDKMKNHMKTVHDCFMPKDCVFPVNFYMPEGSPNFPWEYKLACLINEERTLICLWLTFKWSIVRSECHCIFRGKTCWELFKSLAGRVQFNAYFLLALCLPCIVIKMNCVWKSWTIDLGLMYSNNSLCKEIY